MNAFRKLLSGFSRYFVSTMRWIVRAVVTGFLCGVTGSVFHMAVTFTTGLRETNPWMIFTLPAGGLLIALIYRATKMDGVGTNDIIESVNSGKQVPLLLVPVIFLSTVITHLCGGSAGREGAALQIGGGIGWKVGKVLKLDEGDMRLMTMCGMSAVFSALFGTPLTAALFPLEVASVGFVNYSGLFPCICSALTAYGVSRLFGIAPTRFAVVAEELSPLLFVKVLGLAVVVSVVSIVFCEGMHHTEHLAAKIKNTYLRAIVGGCLVLGMTLILGNQNYNGAGGGIIAAAIETGTCPGAGFALKILFTAVTLGFGFKGGEIVPTFFVGACLGCLLGPVFGIPAGFAAALGLVGLFCGNVNCPMASILLSIELFGSDGLLCCAVMCAVAYLLSGYFGLYKTQKIVYSKIKGRYIDRFTA